MTIPSISTRRRSGLERVVGAAVCVCVTLVAARPASATPPATSGKPAQQGPRYAFDPVLDIGLSASALVIAAFSQVAIDSGELQAQKPGPTSRLPAIDRWVAELDELEEGSRLSSHIGLAAAAVLAAVDSVFSGVRYGVRSGLADAALYAETTLINFALVNVVKLAIRRPRPIAYWRDARGELGDETNLALSFYSGHSSITAGLAGTAAYLAFRRHGARHWASWLTLAVGIAATTVVAVERVRSLSHFPTDVITGAVIGASVGVLVPHLHFLGGKRRVGVAAAPTRGGALVALRGGL